jgi:hypothetical protein
MVGSYFHDHEFSYRTLGFSIMMECDNLVYLSIFCQLHLTYLFYFCRYLSTIDRKISYVRTMSKRSYVRTVYVRYL